MVKPAILSDDITSYGRIKVLPMINRIIAILFLAFIGLSSAILFIPAVAIWICTIAFDRRRVILHMYTSFWTCIYLWTMPAWSLTAVGQEKIRRRATYMVVSYHQSSLDILVAFRLFFPFKWVSKAEMFRVSFIGWNMWLNGYIRIVRGAEESRRKMMAAREKALSKGCSLFFFPDGTRSKDGRLKPFKTGAFILAHKMNVPILPVAINGSKNALPKESLNFYGQHPIRIEVLDEIPYQTFASLNIDQTAELVRERIAAHVVSDPDLPAAI